MNRIVAAMCATAVLACGSVVGFAQAPSPAQAVKERQDIMEKLWPNYYRDMSAVARGQSTDIAGIPAKAAAASEAVKKVSQLFPAGTGRDAVPSTRTKPEAWTQRAEFDGAFTTLINETNTLGEVAKGGNLDAVKAQFQKVAQACGGCHGGPVKSGGKFRFEEQ